MVGAYPKECDLLIFAIYSFNKTIARKPDILGVVVQDRPTSLSHGFSMDDFARNVSARGKSLIKCMCTKSLMWSTNVVTPQSL